MDFGHIIFRILRFLIPWVAKEECECEEVMNFSQLLSCWYIPLRSVEKNRGCDFAQHVVYLILMYNIYKLYIWYFLKISRIENPAQRLFQKECSNTTLQQTIQVHFSWMTLCKKSTYTSRFRCVSKGCEKATSRRLSGDESFLAQKYILSGATKRQGKNLQPSLVILLAAMNVH